MLKFYFEVLLNMLEYVKGNFITIFLYNTTTGKKCSSSNIKGSFIFSSITFFIELIINYSELKDKFFYASINRDLDQRYIIKL
jgi:hypothetical protein